MATTNKYVNYGNFFEDVLGQLQLIDRTTGEWANSYNYQYISENLGYFNYKIITPNSSLTNKYISENRLLYPYFKFPENSNNPSPTSQPEGWDVQWDTSYTYIGVMNSGTKSIKITYGLYNYDKTVSATPLTFTYTVPSLPGPNSTIEVFSPQSNVLYVYFTNGNYGVIDPTCWAYIHFRTSSAPYMDLHDMKVCFDHYEHGGQSTPIYNPNNYYYLPIRIINDTFGYKTIVSISLTFGIYKNNVYNELITNAVFPSTDDYVNKIIDIETCFLTPQSTYRDITLVMLKSAVDANTDIGIGLVNYYIAYETPDSSITELTGGPYNTALTINSSPAPIYNFKRLTLNGGRYNGWSLTTFVFLKNYFNTFREYNTTITTGDVQLSAPLYIGCIHFNNI